MSLKVRTSGILLLHAIFIFCAAVSAWALRFEFHLPNLHLLLTVVPVLIVYRLAGLARFGLLHGYWCYTGLHDGLTCRRRLCSAQPHSSSPSAMFSESKPFRCPSIVSNSCWRHLYSWESVSYIALSCREADRTRS